MSVGDIPALVGDEHYYPAVLELLGNAPPGRILDVPAGHGAFAKMLLDAGRDDVHCLDLHGDQFMLRDRRVNFLQHDVGNPLPYADGFFDYAFSIEGLEHFDNPYAVVGELCRVVRPGGRLYITTPNTLSVDARLKYLVSGYFPRFRPLAKEPDSVVGQSAVHAHISPIYYWQLNHFLLRAGATITRVSTNMCLYKRSAFKRLVERLLANVIRRSMRRRGFPDQFASSEAMLFGDCVIVEAVKSG
ncbi:MAG: class I SAM-dependent methyltransferase [Betaproteobacteria bacterium]|nr:class I SAM-dependent methyltransferase [Betaproteobacteria bacterium]